VAKATVSHDVDSDSDLFEDQLPDRETKSQHEKEAATPLFSSESDSESLLLDDTKEAHLPPDGDKKRQLLMSKVSMIRERRQQVFCWTCRMKFLLSNPQKKEIC